MSLNFHEKSLQKSRNESFDVGELLQTLPKREHERLWTGLRDLTQRLILANPVSSQDNVDSEDEQETAVCFFFIYIL